MNSNAKIKVVKRAEVAAKKAKRPGKPARVAARDMVSTVSDWVADFRTRKSEETKAAIEQLFPATPQPSRP
ncbi:MAG: hypothetical protein UZ17_ACD001002252 [Acidobacteria bacterium OLB17]|nr:MAG: hypothetical protein UZ17_ACD001002252 [Acidobacteria bacterium OLB17]MCZ2389465.1 hypothetical protein [Acidobacteriota bacterium]